MTANFARQRRSKRGMEINMMRLTTVISAALLFGCATQTGSTKSEAIADFIIVTELEPLDVVRLRQQFNYEQLTEDYVVLTTRDDYYLVEFRRRCRELNQNEITPDLRHDRNRLRAGIDTIRGCRIERMFAIDKGQAEELEYIGNEL